MKKIFFTVLLFAGSLFSQDNNIKFSGNLSQDIYLSSSFIKNNDVEMPVPMKKRSVILAAGLSAIVPGAGQIYNKEYWTSALFISIEAAAIVTAIVYNGKGDDQTISFQNFADSPDGWNVDKYAHWSVDNATRINPEIPEGDPVLDIFDNNGNVEWNKLNKLETTIGRWYSHQLAPYGEQQYYEMIGKYQQFNPGWADFNYDDKYNYGDPLTSTFLWYADERGEANHYYDISNLAIKILVANHVISAVEAALSSNSYNRSMNAEVKMKTQSIGFNRLFYPELNLSYRF